MPVREQLEDDLEVQKKIHSLLVEMGLQKLSIPKDYGGNTGYRVVGA